MEQAREQPRPSAGAGHMPPAARATLTPRILEIGTGNGNLLLSLLDTGYPPQDLTGIDYSPEAVQLARSISDSRGGAEITLSVVDFLQESSENGADVFSGSWDLVLDKGTYDAMALMENDAEGRAPSAAYPRRVSEVLKSGGFFLITSCNFTLKELQDAFITVETGFVYHSTVKHPTITFGGMSGSTYCTVAFQKTTK